ncbi:MAG: glycoside hydrolase family 9 protein [Spirochaetales bacterium]
MKKWCWLVGLLLLAGSWGEAQTGEGEHDPVLWVDQLGYRPGDAKIALAETTVSSFQLLDTAGKVAITGTAGVASYDPNSQTSLRRLDFSSLKVPGTYVLVTDSGHRSVPFRIDPAVYREVGAAALAMLHYQRCGTELEAAFAGDFAHAACHLGPAEILGSDRTLLAEGGWHDAGDYGRYVVPGAVAVGHLLLAEELWPGKAPGLLDEARYELEWLLKMQDTGTGGVYHKLTSRNFPGLDVAPDFDFSTQVVSPVSWTATADFAAVMAAGSRLYRATDKAFAERCLKAARSAERWTRAHAFQGFVNPPGIQTGEYGDGDGSDEGLWMNTELFRATGEATFATAVRLGVSSRSLRADAFGWAQTGLFSVVGVLLADTKLDAATRTRAQKLFDGRLAELQQGSLSAPDLTTMSPGYFHWGSNMTLMDHAMLLAVAHRLDPRQPLDAALENLHSLFGRNAVGQSFVTGFGAWPVLNPHHRPSVAAGVFRPVPGMVSGGPNRNLEDSLVRDQRSGAAPARSWIDDAGSYSTNEVAIYWNTPLVFVLAGLD